MRWTPEEIETLLYHYEHRWPSGDIASQLDRHTQIEVEKKLHKLRQAGNPRAFRTSNAALGARPREQGESIKNLLRRVMREVGA